MMSRLDATAEDLSWARALPRKRCSAAALIHDVAGRMLIVKPNYRADWLLPGGIVESGESPLQALLREVREEVGIDVKVGSLICVDYLQGTRELGDALHFLFDCGVLDAAAAAAVRALDPELSAILWAPPEQAQRLLAQPVALRLRQPRGHFLHQGQVQVALNPTAESCSSARLAMLPIRKADS